MPKQAGKWSEMVARMNARPKRKSAPKTTADPVAMSSAFRRNLSGRKSSDAAAQWIGDKPLLESDQYIQTLIDIANGSEVSFAQTFGLRAGAMFTEKEFHTAKATPSDDEWVSRWREPLKQLARDHRSIDEAQRAAWMAEVRDKGQFVLGPHVAGSSKLPFRLQAERLETALYWALLLLTDPNGPVRALCQCRYRQCGKFFFARKQKGSPGRLKRDYCSNPLHKKEEQRLRGIERVQKHRRENLKDKRRRKSK